MRDFSKPVRFRLVTEVEILAWLKGWYELRLLRFDNLVKKTHLAIILSWVLEEKTDPQEVDG